MKTSALFIAAVMVTVQSCNFVKVNKNFNIENENGEMATREFPVESLSCLTFDSHADVVFEISEKPYIKANGAQNVLDRMKVDTDAEGTVWIRMEKNIRYKNLQICVGSPEINKLVFNGAVDFTNKGAFTGRSISIETNGASDLNINDIQAESLNVVTNGASDIDFSGIAVHDIDITINGAGDISLEGKADRGKININGAGDIDIEEFECPEITTNSSGIKRIKK